MALFSASEARKEFFRLLDSVERGEEVVLERRGIRFRLQLEKLEEPDERSVRRLKVADEEVLSGEWTWAADVDGQLRFQSKKDRK